MSPIAVRSKEINQLHAVPFSKRLTKTDTLPQIQKGKLLHKRNVQGVLMT